MSWLRQATTPSPEHLPLNRQHTSTKLQSVACGNSVTALTTPDLTDEFNSRVTLAENGSSIAYDTEKRDTRHRGDNYDVLTNDCHNQHKNPHTNMLMQYTMYQNIPGLRSNQNQWPGKLREGSRISNIPRTMVSVQHINAGIILKITH